MTDNVGSVSLLIQSLRSGDSAAQQEIWMRYLPRLRVLARRRLKDSPQTVADEDDVVIQAYWTILRRLQNGEYGDLQNRQQLWRLLSSATCHKAVSQIRFMTRKKRCSVQELYPDSVSADGNVAEEFELAELICGLLDALPDDEARRICVLRLDGNSVSEIAENIQRSVPTVERRLRLIRQIFASEIGPPADA